DAGGTDGACLLIVVEDGVAVAVPPAAECECTLPGGDACEAESHALVTVGAVPPAEGTAVIAGCVVPITECAACHTAVGEVVISKRAVRNSTRAVLPTERAAGESARIVRVAESATEIAKSA